MALSARTLIRGGHAHFRGMTLYNRHYAVRAVRKPNGEIACSHMSYRSYIRRLQLAALGLGLVLLAVLLLVPGDDAPLLLLAGSYLPGLMERLGTWLLLILAPYLACQFTPLGGYHAAEHQVIAASLRGELTAQQIKQAERASLYCGTVLTALVFAALLPLAFLPIDSLYYLLSAAGLLLLMVVLSRSPRFRRHALVQRLGLAYQWHISTKPPTEEQILLALTCATHLAALE